VDYSYNQFLEDLNMGREIEFFYKSNKYYIGGNWGETGSSMFWKVHDAESEIVGETPEDLIQKVKFDGKSIKDIWYLIKIDIVF